MILTGEPGAGNRPAGFGERSKGGGNVPMGIGLRPGCESWRRMSHQTLPATRLLSTRRWPERIASVGLELVMHTAEGRSIRVLMSLGITAGLAGFVAYYPNYVPRAGDKAEPDGKVNNDRRRDRPDRRGEPGDPPGTAH